MGATVIKEVKIFNIDDYTEASDSIIVFSLCYEKNCYPHTPSWKISFIGSHEEFEDNVVVCLLDSAAGRYCEYEGHKSLVSIGKYYDVLLERKQKLRLSDLNQMLSNTYSFDEGLFGVLDDQEGFTKLSTFTGSRYYKKIESDTDISGLINQTLKLQQAISGKWWDCIPWLHFNTRSA